jgi:MFS family permease
MFVLGHRSFRRLWAAGLLSQAGSQISRIALVLHLFGTGRPPGDLSTLVVLQTLPGAFVAPAAGVVVDRLGPKPVMLCADLARALLLACLVLQPALWAIYGVAVLQSLAGAFFQPARAAAPPRLLEETQLVAANSADHGASSAVMIVGPALGAELLHAAGLRATLLLDAISYLVSATLIAGITLAPAAPAMPAAGKKSAAAEVQDGLRYVATHPMVRRIAGLFFVSVVCAGLWMPLAPFFIRDYLQSDADTMGWQLTAFGVGAVAGSLTAPAMVARWGRGASLFSGLLSEGVVLAAYALVPDVVISTLLIGLWGAAVSLIVVPFYSLMQVLVDERYLGRVFAAITQSENVAIVLAMGATLVMQGRLGSHVILLAAGLLYCTLMILSGLTATGRQLVATR